MLKSRLKTIPSLALLTALWTTPIQAHEGEHLAQGQQLPVISLQDQFEQVRTINEETKLVLFAHDMDGNDLLEQALAPFDTAKLNVKKVVYLADISGMPSLISKLFAIPAMRDRKYSIMLDKEGEISEQLMSKEGQVTLLYLDKLTIDQLEYSNNSEKIEKVLSAM